MTRRNFVAALAGALVAPGRALAVAGAPSRRAPAGQIYALVLGSVQDAGWPQVGCYTPLCDLGRTLQAEGRGRYVASIALVEPVAGRHYLVDATPDITRQLDLIDDDAFRRKAAQRKPFDGIFLTHAHIGHYTGLALLGNEGLGIQNTNVYCTEAMARFLSSNAPWSLLVRQGRIVPTSLGLDRWHRIDENLEVQLWQVPHRDEFADTVGLVFRGPAATLLYVPDINAWRLWERDLSETVAGVDVAMLDASFWSLDELPGRTLEDIPHPLIGDTMSRLQAVVDAGDTRVILTHLNNSNPVLDPDGPEAAEVARRGFEIAREGVRIDL